MVNKDYCNSCKRKLTNQIGSTSFKCPKCDNMITRCYNCREMGVKYSCTSCGFSGPN